MIEYQLEMQSQTGAYVPVTASTYRWSNLPNGVEQQYRVRARNRDTGLECVERLVDTSEAVRPAGDPRRADCQRVGDRSAQVGWTAPGDRGARSASTRSRPTVGRRCRRSATNLNFTGLSNGTAYRFRVRAVNSVGNGGWSGWSPSVTPAGLPQGPSSITATVSGVGAVKLTWPAADANGACR